MIDSGMVEQYLGDICPVLKDSVVQLTPSTWQWTPDPSATAQQIIAGNAAVAGLDGSSQADNAVRLAVRKKAAVAAIQNGDPIMAVIVAFATVNWNTLPQLKSKFATVQDYIIAIIAQIKS